MEETKKEKNNGWSTILLIINLIIWTIILFIWFIYNEVVNALTPVEANFNYDNNGTTTSYNIKPDGGTTGFIYNDEFFGQEVNHSAYRYYKLPGSTLKTTNINGYFQNPCQSNEEMSYTMTINFYKQNTSTNTMSGVSIINGINGCSGYLSQLPDSVVYYNVCTIQPGDVPKFSLYFDESTSGMTTYRVGIPVNFSYTCQVGNQAIMDNATANANNIINNVIQATNDVAQRTTEAINSANEFCQIYDKNSIEKDNYYINWQGEEMQRNTDGITEYIKINSETYIEKISQPNNLTGSICFYNKNKTLINCITQGNATVGKIQQPDGAEYMRFSIYKSENKPQYKVCKTNTQAIIDNQTNMFQQTNDVIHQGLDASYSHVDVDDTKLEDLEDIETDLHTYTNVDLEAIEVNLDPDTGSWVWNTLTRLLNTNTLVFGMIISILSLGVIKMILNR